MTSLTNTLRLGTRGSLLARMQSDAVAQALRQQHPERGVERVIIKTSGDVIADRPLHEVGGKGLFTKELELALLRGEIDFAVHSLKDMPVTMPLVDQTELVIAAVPAREDARDVLVSRDRLSLSALPPSARVGTGSLRRRCQVLANRPDLQVQAIRGNIDTRLRRLREGALDAIVVAMAGVRRTNLFDPAVMLPLELPQWLPAPGQGALALQCRRADLRTAALLAALHDPTTSSCVDAERTLVMKLGGDCLSPIAAHATMTDQGLRLRAAVGSSGGRPPLLWAEATAPSPEAAVVAVMEQLLEKNVLKSLHPHA